jgi:3'-phosphoadenosine 5'-phosphosulfate (PAPS) 3'-phosphatase
MLEAIRDVLTDAVLAGATRVLDVRQHRAINAHYKDATELVTLADQESDTAILAVLKSRMPAIDPAISFHLEESGITGTPGRKWIGADPVDGTSHFAAGGNLYSVQAHYIEDGVPLVGVVFQPEGYLPLGVTDRPVGRLVSAMRGGGAWIRRTDFTGEEFVLTEPTRVVKRPQAAMHTYIACVPMTSKMTPDERALVRRVHDSGIMSGMTGTGGAGGNVLMTVFGGQDVYVNFGAGVDLDLAPPQVIAEEVGFTVWGPDRRPPIWHVRKQPFIVAPNDEIADKFFSAAGL